MTFTPSRLAGITLLSLAMMSPCLADSFASSALSAGSASLGSSSDSVKGSSKSSSGDTKVADGDYRVIEVAELTDRADLASSDAAEGAEGPDTQPGLNRSADRLAMLRLKLQATAQSGEAGALWLTLPREALAQRRLVVGDLVSARQRPYGVEFSRADSHVAFFLVLAGDWQRDIDPRRVTL